MLFLQIVLYLIFDIFYFSDETDGKTRITVERKIHRTFLGPAASPATRELDDLMASLSDAKVRFNIIISKFVSKTKIPYNVIDEKEMWQMATDTKQVQIDI